MQIRELGPRRAPNVFEELSDDLAVELSHEMKRRGCNAPRDLRAKFGFKRRHSYDVWAFLRGADDAKKSFGIAPALRLAQDLKVPVAFYVGDEVAEIEAYLEGKRAQRLAKAAA